MLAGSRGIANGKHVSAYVKMFNNHQPISI